VPQRRSAASLPVAIIYEVEFAGGFSIDKIFSKKLRFGCE
jgi:hypothetical protein